MFSTSFIPPIINNFIVIIFNVIIVYCCIIVVIKGIIIPCFSFMLTLMNNVEKDAATRTNTGKTEKETRPNQPAREPSPPPSTAPSITLDGSLW